jgi:hypothetical protein
MSTESSILPQQCPHPDCGAPITPGKKFCKTCGRPTTQAPAGQGAAPAFVPLPDATVCPHTDCGAPITPGKKFCKTCGRSLQSAAPISPRPTVPTPVFEPTSVMPPEPTRETPATAAFQPPATVAPRLNVPAFPSPEAPIPGPNQRRTVGGFADAPQEPIVPSAPMPPPPAPVIQDEAPLSPMQSATFAAARPAPARAEPSVPSFGPPPPVAPQPRRGNRRMILVSSAAGFLVLAALAYWFTRPKNATQIASVRPTEIAQQPSSQQTSVQQVIPQAAVPVSPVQEQQPAPTASESGQSADALRRERERLATERLKLEQIQREAKEQEARRQQELEAQRQQEAEAQRKAMEELRAKQEEQQRQIEDARRKLAEEQAKRQRDDQARAQILRPDSSPPATPKPSVPSYAGPSSGEIVWEGTVKGTELITIENGQASSGTVTGSLPGVAVLIQPTDPKKVSIASSPGPRNQYSRVVIRVSGNGKARVTLRWSLP